jgi:hypothetical protein
MSEQDGGLAAPSINPAFAKALDELVAAAEQGNKSDNAYFNPPDSWLIEQMRLFKELSPGERDGALQEHEAITKDALEANSQGKAAYRSGPEVAAQLNSGGLAFYSQLGVARRPDLTQYLIDGVLKNRDGIAFSEESQALFSEVLPYLSKHVRSCFSSGEGVVQSDRGICDVPGRSFHARQLIVGTRYMQLPYMWRQLTFPMAPAEQAKRPDIIELSVPRWLEDIGLPGPLKAKVADAGLNQLVFKAPSKNLSLHLGFDYMGEHKMGPLSIAMAKVKANNGLALQAALSIARSKTVAGNMENIAVITTGPSLHGKSTLTIMIELAKSQLADLLSLKEDPEEGVYPMNDDIVLIQPLAEPIETTRNGHRLRISHGIDGTENSFYAVPSGLTREDDPITYDVLRGTAVAPNASETLENVVVDLTEGKPDFRQNPTRNMRMVLSRHGLLERKGVRKVLESITNGRLSDSVHVPMEDIDRVLWQGVMRQNTVVPPLRRLRLEQYVRVLMYGEAVQMGAAAGAIGRPYVEYFSDPFIIGLEDENANVLSYILQQLERGGLRQEFYAFNTGGVGADTNAEASGERYRKVPREITLMLQEAIMRDAVKFEYDSIMGAEVAVAIVDGTGKEVLDLREEWLPSRIYSEDDYRQRVIELRRRRYYGQDSTDKAGILRYTKVTDTLIDLTDIPAPDNERELAWLLSFYWHIDRSADTLEELAGHQGEGMKPPPHLVRALRQMYDASVKTGLSLPQVAKDVLTSLGI